MTRMTRRRWMAWRAWLRVTACGAALAGPLAAGGLAGGHAAPHAAADAEADGEMIASASGAHGVKLGEFSIRTSRAVPSQKNRVTFILYATVTSEEFQNFRELLAHRRHKVREQVIVATRLVPVEDYDDPELKKLRRRIQLRLRRTLPELPIHEIYVSDFDLTVEGT